MDVAGSILGALTGGSNVQIEIRLDDPLPENNNKSVVPMDHTPSWKLHKNPFWRVKHPAGNKLVATPTPTPPYSPAINTAAGHSSTSSITTSFIDPQQGHYHHHAGKHNNKRMMEYAYGASQDVQGTVLLRVPPGKKVEHLGIKIVFLGRIDMSMGIHEGKPHYDFVSLSKELAPPGMLMADTQLRFLFKNMEKEFESYNGRNVSVRYIVKVVMERKFLPPLTYEHDVWVQKLGQEPDSHQAIKMEVGIEDCLHIEFEYERRVYHLQDVIRGQIHFLLVRIKIKHMELAVIRRETSGEGVAIAAASENSTHNINTANNNSNNPTGSTVMTPTPPTTANVDATNIFTETQTLVKYEIMDGAPVKGEIIPVKLCLSGIPADLTPTYPPVNNRFSVRYFLNLVLVDEDDRRYFKQQEIILWRKELG